MAKKSKEERRKGVRIGGMEVEREMEKVEKRMEERREK